MKTIFVILNYHDESRVFSLTNYIESLDQNFWIIIANNNEIGDKSFDNFRFRSNRIILLPPNGNVGYAKGYNFGFQYAIENFDFDFLFCINSDVAFSKDLLLKCETVLSQNTNIGVISSRILTNGQETCSCWAFPTYKEYLSSNYFKLCKQKPYTFPFSMALPFQIVDVVRASFFCISHIALSAVKGYSPNTFLYDNENLLAIDLKKAGYSEAVLTTYFYRHNHKPGRTNHKLLKYSWHDHLYYMKSHLQIGFLKSFVYTTTFFCYYYFVTVISFFKHCLGKRK